MNFLVVLGSMHEQTPQKPPLEIGANFVKPETTRFPYVTKLLRLRQVSVRELISEQGEDLSVTFITKVRVFY